jgi:tetratricopeptide (TPR) repeat protein
VSRGIRVVIVLFAVSLGTQTLASDGEEEPCAGLATSLEAVTAALDEGRWSDAETLLAPLGVSHPGCSGVVVRFALLSAAEGKSSEAEDLFSRALTLAPDDAVAHAEFARFQLSRGLRRQAAYLVGQSLAIDPGCAQALVVRGQILVQRGLYGGARTVLEKALILDPDSFEAHYELGVCCFRINLFEQAAQHFEAASALRPQSTLSLDYLGFSLEMLGEEERAERAYRDAVKANRGPFFDPTLDYNFGRFLLKQGRLEESLTHFDRAVSNFPERRGPRYQRAKVHLAQGDIEKARQNAERALALGKPGDVVSDLQVYFLLASIHSRLGETELAQEYAQRAREAERQKHNQGTLAPAHLTPGVDTTSSASATRRSRSYPFNARVTRSTRSIAEAAGRDEAVGPQVLDHGHGQAIGPGLVGQRSFAGRLEDQGEQALGALAVTHVAGQRLPQLRQPLQQVEAEQPDPDLVHQVVAVGPVVDAIDLMIGKDVEQRVGPEPTVGPPQVTDQPLATLSMAH